MNAKTERLELRLDQSMIDRIDAWVVNQGNISSRSEAVRCLIDAGLESSRQKGPSISEGEKAILSILFDVHCNQSNKFGVSNSIKNIMEGGHYWHLKSASQTLSVSPSDEKISKDVKSILDMWSDISLSYDRLLCNSQEKISGLLRFAGLDMSFPGFDYSSEYEYVNMVDFLTQPPTRFPVLQQRNRCAQQPMLGRYLVMMRVYDSIRSLIDRREHLNETQMIEILKPCVGMSTALRSVS